MKEMNKAKIYIKKSMKSILNEKKFLSKLNYPLISNMYYAFQNKEYLYIILDYLPGGDLRYHISKKKKYSEKEIKFLISNLILSLEYLYNNNIIHRDIKPENLVFDINGYIHLTDFGISCEYIKGKKILFSSGTPCYMAPEVFLKKNHYFTVDYFAVGIIIYELIFGKRPFNGKNRNDIKENILCKEIKVKKNDLNNNLFFDFSICNFVNLLLKRKPNLRLGYNGIYEIKEHDFLKDVNWKKIEKKEIKSPFHINENNDNFNIKYVNQEDDESIFHNNKEYYINIVNESNIFKNFFYSRDEEINNLFNRKRLNNHFKKIISDNSSDIDSKITTQKGNINDKLHKIKFHIKGRKSCHNIEPIKFRNYFDNNEKEISIISEIKEEISNHSNLNDNIESEKISSLDIS